MPKLTTFFLRRCFSYPASFAEVPAALTEHVRVLRFQRKDCWIVNWFSYLHLYLFISIYILEYLKHLFRIKALTSCCHQVTVFKVVFVSSVTFPEYLQEVSLAKYLQEEQVSFETKGSQQGSGQSCRREVCGDSFLTFEKNILLSGLF